MIQVTMLSGRELVNQLQSLIASPQPLTVSEIEHGTAVFERYASFLEHHERQPHSAEWIEAYEEAMTIVRPFLFQSPVIRHIATKPLGIPGDFQLIQMMYENSPSGESQEARNLDAIALSVSSIRAVRNRREYFLRQLLPSAATDSGRVSRILNVACGPAAEVFDFYAAPSARERVCFHLLDFDPRALDFIRQKAQTLPRGDTLEFHHLDVRQLFRQREPLSSLPKFDLVYSIGLVDYFDDRSVVRLINSFRELLAPQGQLLLGNFHPKNPVRSIMDHVLDWRLIHRTESQMHTLAAASNFQKEFDAIEFEPQGINLFARIALGS